MLLGDLDEQALSYAIEADNVLVVFRFSFRGADAGEILRRLLHVAIIIVISKKEKDARSFPDRYPAKAVSRAGRASGERASKGATQGTSGDQTR